MKSTRSPTEFDQDNRDVTSIPGYVIKKNSSRGAKHGLSERQKMYASQTELMMCTHCWRVLCGTTPESKFMLGRPRYTTGQEFVQKHVIVWNEGHDWPHKRRGCGGGLDVNPEVRGIKVLGTPLGHPAYVTTQLQHIRQDQQLLLDRIPLLPDVQSAWALLVHCASARATYFLRVVSPEQSFQFATSHDTALWECLGTVVGVTTPHIRSTTHESVCLPLAFGGLGLRSAVRTAAAAYWARWGDSLGMIQQRHPAVARTLVHELVGGQSQSVHLLAASMAAAQLTSLNGFEVPSWPALAAGDRPP